MMNQRALLGVRAARPWLPCLIPLPQLAGALASWSAFLGPGLQAGAATLGTFRISLATGELNMTPCMGFSGTGRFS